MDKQRALSTLKRMKHQTAVHDEKESLNIAIQYLKLHLNSEYGTMINKKGNNTQ